MTQVLFNSLYIFLKLQSNGWQFSQYPCVLQTKTYLDYTSVCVRIVLIFNFVFFQAKCLEIEDFRWYKSLVLFGCGDDPYDIDVDDPDVKLIPMVLEKSLIPKLTGIKFQLFWPCKKLP